MIERFVLDGLLVLTLVFSVLLVLISAGTTGRKLADLEYQQAAGINGVRKIQSWVNIRTHVNRVFLGAAVLLMLSLSLAEAPLWMRLWVNSVLPMLVIASYALASSLDWRDERRQLRIIMAQESDERARVATAGIDRAESRADTRIETARSDAAAQVAESHIPSPVDVTSIHPGAAQAIADAMPKARSADSE